MPSHTFSLFFIVVALQSDGYCRDKYRSRYALATEHPRAPEPTWKLWRENNLLPLPGIESRILGRPAPNLVAIPTELSRLP
jgi:hypothetical protein